MPVRSYILARCFDEEDLRHLDPYDETEDEYHEEQHAIHLQKNDSFSEDDLDFPNRAEFRGKGYQKELRQRHRLESISDVDEEAGHHSATLSSDVGHGHSNDAN